MQTEKEKISGVVPTATWDFERVQLMLKSLKKFFDPKSMDTLFVIFPDKPKMQKVIDDLDLEFNVKVLSEKDVIPKKDYKVFKKRKGWYRQQVIKLYISTLMNTPFYICLDADVLCIKSTSHSDLIKNGKICCNIESKSIHQKWWENSRKVLGVSDPGTESGMTSSTNIFITRENLELIKHVETMYRKSFVKTLMNWFWISKYTALKRWTEYKLYWSFIEYRNQIDAYDLNCPVWGKSIWRNTENLNEELFAQILDSSNEGNFAIIQSSRVDDDTAKKMVHKYLQID